MAEIKAGNKPLSVFALVAINIIAIDSLRNLSITASYGFALPFVYLLICLFFLIPSALVTAECATHHPKMGGAYVWIKQALGPRAGLVAIWLQWIYNVIWFPTILAFISAHAAYLINPNLANNTHYLVACIISVFGMATLANWYGMRTSSWVSIASALVGTLVPMTTIIFLAYLHLHRHLPLAISPTASAWLPQPAQLSFLVVGLFSVFGLEMSASHAEAVANPKKDYPRALLISSVLIVLTLVLSSLAIAIIVPPRSLNLVTGIHQALTLFLKDSHHSSMLPALVAAIILGSFGSIAAWAIGPTKGLLVAAKDGLLPPIFKQTNRYNSPSALLLLQMLLVTILSLSLLLAPSFQAYYWILADLKAQLALFFYVLFFIAGWRLGRMTPSHKNAFRLKNNVRHLVCGMGVVTCASAFFVGFVPPAMIQQRHQVWMFEIALIAGILLTLSAPLLLYRLNRGRQKK